MKRVEKKQQHLITLLAIHCRTKIINLYLSSLKSFMFYFIYFLTTDQNVVGQKLKCARKVNEAHEIEAINKENRKKSKVKLNPAVDAVMNLIK